MAYTDPQVITIATVANSLPRTGSGIGVGTFQKDDSTIKLDVTHVYAKRVRRTVRLNHSKIATDPLQPTNNTRLSASVYLVADVPITGYSPAEVKGIIDALTGWLTASTGANATKFVGGEA